MIEVTELTKRYGKKTALSGAGLSLGKGIYGLLGPNGAGKTTLIRCLVGVLRPTGGTITIQGETGYLPQKFGVMGSLTAYEALDLFAELKGLPREARREEILDSLARVGLEDAEKRRVKALSGGMVRRLGVAQAILGDPENLILDEPTAGLDPEERLRFKNLFAQFRGRRTVLISTHIVEDVESLCDHIILMNGGRILTVATADELRSAAQGKVYSVPVSERENLQKPFFLLRDELAEGQERLRVLSDVEQPGQRIPATVEDGYMRYLKGAV